MLFMIDNYDSFTLQSLSIFSGCLELKSRWRENDAVRPNTFERPRPPP